MHVLLVPLGTYRSCIRSTDTAVTRNPRLPAPDNKNYVAALPLLSEFLKNYVKSTNSLTEPKKKKQKNSRDPVFIVIIIFC